MLGARTRHTRFATDDLAQANELVRSISPKASLFAQDEVRPFSYVQEMYEIPGLRLTRLGVNGRVLAGADEDDAVSVAWAVAGRLRYDYRNHSGDQSDMLVLQPGPVLPNTRGSLTAVMEDIRFELASLDRARLEATARTLYGDDRLRVQFDSPRPVSPQLAKFWTKAQRITWDLVADGAGAHSLVQALLYRSMAVATLESFRLLGDQEERYRTVMAQSNAYERGVRFIEDHASLPITIDDAAQAAGVSTAGLVRAFDAHSPAGVTPALYLRRVRLDAARADLMAGDPGRGDTVREIALRWGFADSAGFARAYKKAYGTTPGATLRS